MYENFFLNVEFGILGNIGNVGNDILKVKLRIWKIRNIGNDILKVKLRIWKIGNVGNDILKVKLHVGCAYTGSTWAEWEVWTYERSCGEMYLMAV